MTSLFPQHRQQPWLALALTLGWTSAPLTSQGPAAILKDLDPSRPTGASQAGPRDATPVGNRVFFRGPSPNEGYELWVTDFTAAGTRLVRDLRLGTAESSIREMTPFGNQLVFTASTPEFGRTVWISDGTPAGTRPLLLGTDPEARSLTVVGNRIFFSASTAAHGTELWVSNGTPAGTEVLELAPGTASSQPFSLTAWSGRLWFAASSNFAQGTELWTSDGTTAGTRLVKDIAPQTNRSSSPRDLTPFGSRLVFSADDGTSGTELWQTDGTTAGTTRLADIVPGVGGSSPWRFAATGNLVYFTATTPSQGSELWRTDGTATGTRIVREINSGPLGTQIENKTAVGNSLFFTARDALAGEEVWVTDGTTAGTRRTRDIQPGALGSGPRQLTAFGGQVYFVASDGMTGFELWTSDGTSGGTRQVIDLVPGPSGANIASLQSYGAELLFHTIDQSTASTAVFWRSNGTAAGTTRRLSYPITTPNGSSPSQFVSLDGRTAFFAASTRATGFELWRTDGTAAGTQLVRDIQPGTSGSNPERLTPFGDRVLFSAVDAAGREPWISDGTAAGTFRLADIARGSAPRFNSSHPNFLVQIQGLAYFTATSEVIGTELWATDGTRAGTRLAFDFTPGGGSSQIYDLLRVGDTIFASIGQRSIGGDGAELYRTDGTRAGTTKIKDLIPGSRGSNPHEFVEFQGRLFFLASSPRSLELWQSDGTTAGTALVKELPARAGFGDANQLTVVADQLFFTANDFVRGLGRELWVSNGTAAGTRMVRDIEPGFDRSSFPRDLVALGSKLLFFAADSRRGRELWQSDGTLAGTNPVVDLAPGPESGTVGGWLAPTNGRRILFLGYSPDHGIEPWVTDGTPAGTRLHQDLIPGTRGSWPRAAAAVGNTILFGAFDPQVGTELWRMDNMASVQPYGFGCPGAGNLVPQSVGIDTPNLGNAAFAIELRQARPNSAAALLIAGGAGTTPLGGGANGTSCRLLVDSSKLFLALTRPTGAAGQVRTSLAVPNNPSLIGGTLWFQHAVLDNNGAGLGTFALSNGMIEVIARD